MATNNVINSGQSLDSSSSPQFTGMNLSGLTASLVVMTDSSKNMTTSSSNNLTISTWTPSMGDGTNNFSTSTATGQYVQIGSLVLASEHIVWTGKGSASAGSQLKINMPFAVGASDDRVSIILGFTSGIGFTGSYLTGTATTGGSTFSLFGFNNSGTATGVNVSNCGTSGELQATFIYWKN